MHLIRIRQEHGLVSRLTKGGDVIEFGLRQFRQHAHPCFTNLLNRCAFIAILLQGGKKLIG